MSNSTNSLTRLKIVFFGTTDGLFALAISVIYWIVAILLIAKMVEVPSIGREELVGIVLMPILFICAHIWHRTGVSDNKRLHMPSIIAVSTFAILVPIIRFGGI